MDTTTEIYNLVSSTQAMVSQRFDWVIVLLVLWVVMYGIGFIARIRK